MPGKMARSGPRVCRPRKHEYFMPVWDSSGEIPVSIVPSSHRCGLISGRRTMVFELVRLEKQGE